MKKKLVITMDADELYHLDKMALKLHKRRNSLIKEWIRQNDGYKTVNYTIEAYGLPQRYIKDQELQAAFDR